MPRLMEMDWARSLCRLAAVSETAGRFAEERDGDGSESGTSVDVIVSGCASRRGPSLRLTLGSCWRMISSSHSILALAVPAKLLGSVLVRNVEERLLTCAES
jgi:hypothetical protein